MLNRKKSLVFSAVIAVLGAGMTLPALAGDDMTDKDKEIAAANDASMDKHKAADKEMREKKSEKYTDSKTRDAWLDGKLELAYTVNRHLNPFSIDTRVVNGVAHLSGTVESEIDKELAKEVAMGIDGITDVKSELKVDKEMAHDHDDMDDDHDRMDDDGDRSFSQWFDDATTTASVKSKLLANEHTEGLEINVDTMYDVVTLSGSVGSSEEKDLAGEVAKNTDGVRDVKNRLEVVAQ